MQAVPNPQKQTVNLAGPTVTLIDSTVTVL